MEQPFRWLVLYMTNYSTERRFFHNKIKRVLMNHARRGNSTSVVCDLLHADCPVKTSPSESLFGLPEVGVVTFYQVNGANCSVRKVEDPICVSWAMAGLCKGPYDGFMYCGHSQGFTLGYYPNHAMTIVELSQTCKIINGNKKFEIMILDCCYGGILQPLYELCDESQYCLATPSYHDGFQSFLQFQSFWNKTKGCSIEWMDSMASEYVRRASYYSAKLDFPVQWVVYDMQKIKELTNALSKNGTFGRLDFPYGSVIYPNDVFLLDLQRPLESHKSLSNILKNAVLSFHKVLCQPNVVFSCLGVFGDVPTYMDKGLAMEMKAFRKLNL